MGKVHVYITPFDENGNYASEIEVTEDVATNRISSLKERLDLSEYDIGVTRTSTMRLSLRNDTGKFSDVDQFASIFRYKRSGSKVRITWEPNEALYTAFFFVGEGEPITSDEITIFTGILEDQASKSEIKDQVIDFQVFGRERLLQEVTVPFADISNGDTVEEVILAMVDQAPFNELVTVSSANISVENNLAIDDKTSLEEKSVFNELKNLLLIGNAVLFIEDDTLYVSPRTADPTVAANFYGEGSLNGIENLIDVKNYQTGTHRIKNLVVWTDTTLTSTSGSSATLYGVQRDELKSELITDTAKRQTVLDSIVSEFAEPMQEFDIVVPMTPDNLDLFLLDRISVDYPSLVIEGGGAAYGVGIYGQDRYGSEINALVLNAADNWKIVSREVNVSSELINFRVRKI